MGFTSRIRRKWNLFRLTDNVALSSELSTHSTPYFTPRSTAFTSVPAESVVAKLYSQIAIDAASVTFRHIRVDSSGNYVENYSSSIGDCMAFRPNVDQTWADFMQDLVWTMFTYGAACIVPVDTSDNPVDTESFEVYTMRIGRVVQWYPRSVKIDLYDDREGDHKQIILPKEIVAIVANPLYDVMNKPNSDLQRLLQKLSYLDAIDTQSASGKLDVIIQLPYTVNNDLRTKRAKARQKDLERQLAGSRYGVAFTERGESVVQLNRPANNNLMDQVKWLTEQVYSSLGISEEVFTGKASESQMLMYYNRTVNPILQGVAVAMSVAFLSRTARTQGQRIRWFRDPFKLVPMSAVGDLVQALTSAEVMTSNEARPKIGLPLSNDPQADKLVNSNINQTGSRPSLSVPRPEEEDPVQNGRNEP